MRTLKNKSGYIPGHGIGEKHPIVIKIFSDTYDIINRAINDGKLVNSGKHPPQSFAEAIEIMVAKYFNLRIPNVTEIGLLQNYGFTRIEQLDKYYELLACIKQEKRSPETYKSLRQAIIEGTEDVFMTELENK